MKVIEMRSLLAVAITSVALYGCASSDDSNATAMEEDMTMSETQTMAGDTDMEDADAVVVTEEVVAVAPIATIPIAALSLDNPVEVNDMFEDIEETEQYNLMDLARKSPNLSTFVQLMDASGLSNDFKEGGAYTMFAPTNEAFSKLSKQQLEMLILPENQAKLAEVLMVHILPSEVYSTDFNETQRIELTEDKYIPITTRLNGKEVIVGGATIVKHNIEADNGVIHVVDNVIIPSENAVEDEFR